MIKINNMVNRKFFPIFSLAIIGLFSFFFIPKANQLAWRATSIIEFKFLKLASIFYQNPANNTNEPENYLASHRGVFSETVAENSEKSIIMAAQKGFHYIELDVSFSRDHIPFIFHDISLKLKTNLDSFAGEVSWEEIRKLRLSDSQKILSLKLFFSEFAQLFDGIILDIKDGKNYTREKADSFNKVISESNFSNDIFVIGRHCMLLATIKRMNPKLKVGCEDKGFFYNYITSNDLLSLNYNNQFSYLEYCLAKRFDLTLILWTVNKEQDLDKLRNLKNTIILTDLHNVN